MLDVTFYGNAAFSIASPDTTVLVDPYLTENEECPWNAREVLEREHPDAICVTHAAFDHVGDAAELARDDGIPVLTEPATARSLRAEGVPADQITSAVWGMEAEIGDISVRILETRHISYEDARDEFVSGVPLSFLFRADSDSVYHMGDTSIFRDLKTYGDLHEPDVVLVGVGQAFDAVAASDGPITLRISELSTEEAVLATRWLGADRAVPMHFVNDEREQFLEAMADAEGVPDPVPLDPGESLRVG
ncbi:MBL fold metallo-hydrolase [Natrinema caseinilyticum]|uniref:MBL fold metallo-hydrolase n=1 Tax=Natrinema caseinilyticum TaxID=2961570 RepID=UPI0020C28526|nr:MBL fold metallo-hydrolase [Natrinema caseinilyticum]